MALPALGPEIFNTVTEEFTAGRPVSREYGQGEARVDAGRDRSREHIWLYALPNPQPDKPLRELICAPVDERSLIYAISHTQLNDHPLRGQVRQKRRLVLPAGTTLNPIHELDNIAIDLGDVISARAALDYDHDAWAGPTPNVQPERSESAVLVEFAAHPAARLYVGQGDKQQVYELGQPDGGLTMVGTADRPVTIRVVEKGSNTPVPVRLHIHGAAGEYLPPRGYHRQVNPHWFEDNYGEFVNGRNNYCYIPGECIADLPLGDIYIEATRGYEVAPLRGRYTISPETEELTLELDRVLDWRAQGWVTADTHVHFLTPQTALLEGSAEGVNVVNLLASQWGEMFSNVSDFDGRTTLGAKEFGGDGEFLVRVGTENRMQVLGHISLLGYSGRMIHPLCTGGPSESALGDPQEVTMADWAQRCLDQNGLVIMPHGPNPQCERAADIVLGLVDGIEMMTFNPHDWQINPYGIADWYRYLNLGYQVPVVGGSDKMAASMLLGGVRTYAHLGDRPFSYDNWMAAVRAGNTFVTVGPLLELSVAGQAPGSTLRLPAGGGHLDINWRVESVRLPIEQIEVIVGGLVVEQINVDGALRHEGHTQVNITGSTWIGLRVRGSYRGIPDEIAAHSSAVQILVDGQELFAQADAIAVLEQIEGAIAYVDTLATRPAAQRYKQLRLTLESAYNRLHQRLHQQGLFHHHLLPNNHHES
ncbi:MAG: CehA/McbA family metallohydrolase [Ardenticatenales bacterium]|nr:CehA/McbA family metallohydrolase [Ardenticatenales bacterium]